MNISSETHLAAVVLKRDGEFTADVADQFRREVKDILQSSDSNFIIDCQCMQLIDSVGLESLLWLSDELNRNGQKLRFTNVPETVKSVFELTRLSRVFNVHDNVESAARSFV